MSSLSEKLVDFDIMVESEPRPIAPAKPTGLTEQTSSLEESIYRLSGSFSSIQRTQRYFRTRENRNVRPASSGSLSSFRSLPRHLLSTLSVGLSVGAPSSHTLTPCSLRYPRHTQVSTVRSTEWRIFTFSLLESCLMVGMSAFQVWVVQRFFSGPSRRRVV